MRVNNNIMAMNTHRQLAINNDASAKSIEKLSSAYRNNKAGDDAAGLNISDKMRSQIRGLQQGSRDAQDGISMLQTSEGTLSETHSILQRVRELAVQSSNDTNMVVDRTAVREELSQLSKEITRIAHNAEFDTRKVWGDGTEQAAAFRVGADQSVTNGLTQEDTTKRSQASIAADVGQVDSNASIEDVVNNASQFFESQRSKLGATRERLAQTIQNLDTVSVNLSTSEARVRDVDMAAKMMEFTKDNILNQAATSMLAQANQQPQGVLQLLR